MNNSQQLSFAASKMYIQQNKLKIQWKNNTQTMIPLQQRRLPNHLQRYPYPYNPQKLWIPFMFLIPTKIPADIVALLPQHVQLVCMQVSRKLWREQVLYSGEAWKVLSLENGEKDIPFIRAASSLAPRFDHGHYLRNCHPSLVYLELSSPLITGHDIELILQGFQELRRLIADDCDDSVLEVMVDQIDGPPFPMLHEKKRKVVRNEDGKKIKKQGLRVLYTSYGERRVRSEYFIPLMYKHRDILEDIRACLSPLSVLQMQEFYEQYPQFKLENLKHLAIWLKPGILEFMLRTAVRGAKELSSITAVDDHNLELLFAILLEKPLLIE
ncbi:hypothetical protein BDA99DRAFT_557630 [Phascolomyces articulosus]|uniref:Uncharacterized protein n=1 Tax=Phascolomyces articulosus TaxID=60185 RepID=A0AAD5PG54_9FUNG|nr:hypothetical protein BDA99DRAFT_557630 [Phascolomyces articulosus]